MIKLYATEDQEQSTFVNWLLLHPKLKRSVVCIGNEGKRSLRQGALMKRKGLRKGASDLFIAYPTSLYSGLWIEMKAIDPRTGKYRKPTKEQLEFLEDMRQLGYDGHVANGADHAIMITSIYLNS